MELTLTAEDVRKIPTSVMPLIVLSDNLRSFLSWGIKAHTKGCYSHVMMLIDTETLVSQDFPFFREVPVDKYLQGGHRLKFVGNSAWTNQQRLVMRLTAKRDARLPWWKRRYDLLGILGQFCGVESINVPWLNYCSEKVAGLIKIADPLLQMKHPSPDDMNWYMENNQNRGYYVYGRYAPD